MSDFLDSIDDVKPDLAAVISLADIGQELKRLQIEATKAQEAAAKATYALVEYQTKVVPAAFKSAGVMSLELVDGGSVVISKQFHCSPNKNAEDQEILRTWLEEQHGDHLIKPEVRVIGDNAELVAKDLASAGIPYEESAQVATVSLKAWIKAQLEHGDISLDSIPKCVHFVSTEIAEVKL